MLKNYVYTKGCALTFLGVFLIFLNVNGHRIEENLSFQSSSEHVFQELILENQGQIVTLTSFDDGTSIQINGSKIKTLEALESFQIDLGDFDSNIIYLQSSLECGFDVENNGQDHTFEAEFSKTFESGGTNYFLLPPAAQASFEINGAYFKNTYTANWYNIEGKSGWIIVSDNSGDNTSYRSDFDFYSNHSQAGFNLKSTFLPIVFLDPFTGLPTTGYTLDTLCQGDDIDHCLLIDAGTTNHNITSFTGNEGEIIITPFSAPFDTCFKYTAPLDFTGTDTFTLTVTGQGDETASIEITIVVVDPDTPIDAGPILELCSEFEGTLSAIDPDPLANGYWTILGQQGTIVIDDPNSPTTLVTGLELGESTFLWTQEYPCEENFDITQIIVYDGEAPPAAAGPDVFLCSDDNTYTMVANDPLFTATGTWEIVMGTATIFDINDPNALVVNLGVGQNVFEWNIDNGPCPGGATVDQMIIFVYDQNFPEADAGPDQEFCEDEFTSATIFANPDLDEDDFFPAVGSWELISGTGTIDDPLSQETTITDCEVGENVFQWSIVNGPCGASTSTVTITIYEDEIDPPFAGDDVEYCVPTTFHVLEANEPDGPAFGTWTVEQGTASFGDINDPNTTASNLGLGQNILRWTYYNGPCDETGDFDEVTITIFDSSSADADAGLDQEYCETDFTSLFLDANDAPFPSIGTWTLVSGTGTFLDANDPNTEVIDFEPGVSVFQWEIYNGPCGEPTTDTVEISLFIAVPATPFAGEDASFCTPISTYVMDATPVIAPYEGTWTLVSGEGTISDVNDPNADISGLGIGANIFRWTLSEGPCLIGEVFDEMTIFIFDENQPLAEAGEDQEFCFTPGTSIETNLDANEAIFPGLGTWSNFQGGGFIQDPNDPQTLVSGLPVGENIFIWTIDNGPCNPPTSTDTVSVFIFPNFQLDAEAGPDQFLCSDGNTTNLAGNNLTFPATGTWTVVSGGGTIVDSSDPNTLVTGIPIGVNVFEWTIDNGPCEPSITTDTMEITVYEGALSIADAGDDQSYCSNEIPVVSLDGNFPVFPATGTWSLTSGQGSITDPTNPTTTLSNLGVGENVFTWTVNNGACSGFTDDQVSIFIYDHTSTQSDAGPDQFICNTQLTTFMDALDPIAPSTGTWVLESGSGTIVDPTDPNTEITNLAIGENVFSWTQLNGPCDPPLSQDLISIFVFDETAPNADAGDDQEYCTPVDATFLDGNPYVFPATGVWTLVSGSGDINDPTDPNSLVENLSVGVNVFEWTLDQGACPGAVSSDQVSITIYDLSQENAEAGDNIEICTPNSSTFLDGSAIISPAVGTWTLITGTGTIIDPNDPNTEVTNLSLGINVFEWTVDNGPCNPEIPSDQVIVEVLDSDADPANAGDDQEICLPTNSTNLDGNVPSGSAIGTWTLLSGTGDIDDPNDPNTLITNLGVGINTFVWTIDNGDCGVGVTSDQVDIYIFSELSEDAFAGFDQDLCSPTSSTTMNANSPIFPAVGTWTLVSGSASIDDPNDPNTLVTNLVVGVAVLEWTVYNGPCSNSTTSDQVSVSVFDSGAPQAEAGDDQEFCSPTSTTFMDAVAAFDPGEGTWTLFSGAGNIIDENDPNSLITDLEIGINTFVWSLDYATCGSQSDTVDIIIFDPLTTDAFAGDDQELCTPINSTFMDADPVLSPGTGTWTLIEGFGIVLDENDPNSEVVSLTTGENVFVWTIYNGNCTTPTLLSDTVSISVFENAQEVADAGDDIQECSPIDMVTLSANPILDPAIGTWTILSGSGQLVDANDPTTDLINLTVGTTVLEWTVDNGPCDPSITTDQITVEIFDSSQEFADAGEDIEICTPDDTATLNGNVPISPATGTWEILIGSGVITDPSNPNTTITGLTVGETICRWIIDNGPCDFPSQDFVSIFIYDENNEDAMAGDDQEICFPTNQTTLNGNSPIFPAEGTWTLFSGTGDIISENNPNTAVENMQVGTNIFVWTVYNGACANSITSDTVVVEVFNPTGSFANTGDDQAFCWPTNSTTLSAVAPISPATGSWSIMQGGPNIVIDDVTNPNSGISGLDVGITIMEWTIYNGPCPLSGSSDLLYIYIYSDEQELSDAGPDQSICTPQTGTFMDANDVIVPAVGTWQLTGGSGDIVNINNPNTDILNLGVGVNTFVWTINNGPCFLNSQSTVTITVYDVDAPPADAGEDQELCFPNTTTDLEGNEALNASTGMWTVINGTGVFDDPTQHDTEVSGLSIGINTFEWSIDNGLCGSSTDVVEILVFDPEAPVADAGDDQSFCTPTSTTILQGNTPAVPGTGTWNLESGNATIGDVNDPNSVISGLTIGENVLCWTIYNGPCDEPTVDCVSIFIYDENAEDADAGEDQEICLPDNEVTMNANSAISPAIGEWTIFNGGGTITNINDPLTTVTELPLGTNTFVWSIDNTPCGNGLTTDTVVVYVFEEVIDLADAGPDQEFCTPTSSTVMAATPPNNPNIGTWDLVSGTAVFNDPNDPSTLVSGLTIGDNVCTWTIYNGPCLNEFLVDTVIISIFDQNQLPADAGTDIELCLPDNSIIADGNIPTSPAVGTWTLDSGFGNILEPNNPTTTITSLAQGENVFIWTIDNGPCDPGITTDTLSVFVFDEGADLADAGPDIDICTPESCVTLQAAVPSLPSYGTWVIVSGAGTISDVNDPNAEVCALVPGQTVLEWTIYNGPCDQNFSFDFVNINVYESTQPPADAGPDQEFCAPVASTFMDAVDLTFPSTGTWTLDSGGGTIVDAFDPNTELTDLDVGTNVLIWSVQNGPCENSLSSDTVIVSIYDPESPSAFAGDDQFFCTTDADTNLDAADPIAPSIGTWDILSGGGDIADINDPNSFIDNLELGETIILWSVYNGPCENTFSTDTVSIFVNDNTIADADAGPDLEFCGQVDQLQMQGSVTIGNTATGEWTILSGGGTFDDIHDESTIVHNIPIGVNSYQWTVDNGLCGITSSTVTITVFNPEQESAYAGEDLFICEHEFIPFDLNATPNLPPATGYWTIEDGFIELDDLNDPEATVTDLGFITVPLQPEDNLIIWHIDNGPCGTTSDSLVVVLEDCLTIDVPDAFSPNGDGINDTFDIPNLDTYPGNSIKIFNRWGALIYEAAPYNGEWDGRSHHGATIGEEAPVSTYYYILELGSEFGSYNGFVYLKR